MNQFHPSTSDADSDRPNSRAGRRPLRAAAGSTVLLLLVLLMMVVKLGGSGRDDPGTAGSAGSVQTLATPTLAAPNLTAEESPAVTIQPAAPLPSATTVLTEPGDDDGDGDDGEIGPAIVPTVPPPLPEPPQPPLPAPRGVLSVQQHYALDPGVRDVVVTLANVGAAPLTFDVANAGNGFTVDVSHGALASGANLDVHVSVEVDPLGDGPTPFERVIEVTSDGGNAAIEISGQAETPAFVIAEFESTPFVDYRAHVRFTNVGQLSAAITAVKAPGLRLSPLPEAIEAGETLEIDVAVCAAGVAALPVHQVIPSLPQPIHTFRSSVEIITPSGGVQTVVIGVSHGFVPPSCKPVINVGPLDLAPQPTDD